MSLFLKGSYFGKLRKENCRIILDKSTDEVYRLIRGVSLPYHGAFLDDIKIYRASIAKGKLKESLLSKYKNNGIYFTKSDGNLLRLMDGVLIIDKYERINSNEKENN